MNITSMDQCELIHGVLLKDARHGCIAKPKQRKPPHFVFVHHLMESMPLPFPLPPGRVSPARFPDQRSRQQFRSLYCFYQENIPLHPHRWYGGFSRPHHLISRMSGYSLTGRLISSSRTRGNPATMHPSGKHRYRFKKKGFGETGMNRFGSHQNHENRTLYKGPPPQGLSEAQRAGNFFTFVTDPPRGRSVGGGGIHRR